MYVRASTFASVALPALAVAGTIPTYDGMTVVFSEEFAGKAGDSIDTDVWDIATSIDTNSEVQAYTAASSNLQLSGGGTVQLVPWKASSGAWTSGRIETKTSWTPSAGKVMRIEASARTGGGDAANAQGMWPAIWMLGDSIRHGTGWPQCGEIDMMEMVNGIDTAYGTIHCTADVCHPDTSAGYQGSVATDDNWHKYTVLIDRTLNNWTAETIKFMKDDAVFFTATGADFGDEAVWGALAHSPLYMIMNTAVGGTWPGDPNSSTLDGYGNMLEVDYVAKAWRWWWCRRYDDHCQCHPVCITNFNPIINNDCVICYRPVCYAYHERERYLGRGVFGNRNYGALGDRDINTNSDYINSDYIVSY